jgi:hypothetical protein
MIASCLRGDGGLILSIREWRHIRRRLLNELRRPVHKVAIGFMRSQSLHAFFEHLGP